MKKIFAFTLAVVAICAFSSCATHSAGGYRVNGEALDFRTKNGVTTCAGSPTVAMEKKIKCDRWVESIR